MESELSDIPWDITTATAVLRSQDCLLRPQPHPLPQPEPRSNMNPFRSLRRKRSPTGLMPSNNEFGNRVPDRKDPVPAFSVKNNNHNLVMGQVKILKRGKPLPETDPTETTPSTDKLGFVVGRSAPLPDKIETTPSADKLGFVVTQKDDQELILCSTDRLGPDPQMVQKQIRASDFYAGSGPIVASPDPNSLPFPALLAAKKEKKSDAAATMDLLRLLRLDLP